MTPLPTPTPTPILGRFTITFDPAGGNLSLTSAITVDDKLPSLPVPTRRGYRFDGWYTSASGGTQVTPYTVFSSSVTIYAHWSDMGAYKNSGGSSLAKLSKLEISRLLEAAPLTKPETIFSQEPSLTAPYVAGQVTGEALNGALDRLNAMRTLAGLPKVRLDDALNENAQHGAVLLAVSSFSHTPERPGDMDDLFYQKGYSATSSSNIHYGSGGLYGTLSYSVDGFMDDSDSSNISRLGHRRWQLNPKLGKVGFGCAQKGGAGYICEKVFDTSGPGVDYEFISWPASGFFPNDLFDPDTAWSVSLNPALYEAPSLSGVSVTLRRESDKKSWEFSGSGYTAASSGKYFTVNTGGYGVSNCIIFRPDEIEAYDGEYTITINGLRTKSGEQVYLSYFVDFFNTAEAVVAPLPSPTANVPAVGTAYPSTQSVEVDGRNVEFQMYALKDANGYSTNYVKVRDLALALNGTPAQFGVGWDGAVLLAPGVGYVANGSENSTPFSGDRPYTLPMDATYINGSSSDLFAILLNDDQGGGYTYYQLRDLGRKLGFNVGWSGQRGVFVETDRSYREDD